MTSLLESTTTRVACLSDEQLLWELRCAERCALLATRTRRDLALLRIRCLRQEIERRALRSVSPSAAGKT